MNDESKITIEQIEDILDDVLYTDSSNRIKIYIECEIDKASGQYRSSLLEQIDSTIKERITK